MMAIFAVALLTSCGLKENKKEEFKATLNKSKVMMNSDYEATVKLKTAKDATFEVVDNKKHSVQGIRTTKTGKENIVLKNIGKYEIIVKDKDENITKKLRVKVLPYKKNINRATSSVAGTQFNIQTVTYEKVKKPKNPTEDAELNMDSVDGLNKVYYRVVISYELINNNDKSINPQYTEWSPIDDSGKDYTGDGNAYAYSFDSIIGTQPIQPHTRKTGELVMISNNKFRVDHLKINLSEQVTTDGGDVTTFANGGILSLDGNTTNNSQSTSNQQQQQATQQTTDSSSSDTDTDTDGDSYVEETYEETTETTTYSDDSDDSYDADDEGDSEEYTNDSYDEDEDV